MSHISYLELRHLDLRASRVGVGVGAAVRSVGGDEHVNSVADLDA